MKSITIHNLDKDLAKKIEDLSKEKGISQNKLIKALLRKILNLEDEHVSYRKEYFSDLFGSMSSKEAQEFFEDTADLDKIDPTQW